ncbi:hypothetical protein JB92DRAFT_2864453 [Gautieria morchelliformis]|nr:hypothetical protein JB92DRAFT_2864453 [Gautieria morchelliformis]
MLYRTKAAPQRSQHHRVHKTKAMQLVEDEEEGLADSEVIIVADIFMRNTAAADMYLAMRNKPWRQLWLNAWISEEISCKDVDLRTLYHKGTTELDQIVVF